MHVLKDLPVLLVIALNHEAITNQSKKSNKFTTAPHFPSPLLDLWKKKKIHSSYGKTI